ncbi:MAG: hypothetical protein F7O42_11200 [Opitutae bacterium]|nr:hypothetical protein [Opitutae bacterium]
MKFVTSERRSSVGAGFEPRRGCSWVDTLQSCASNDACSNSGIPERSRRFIRNAG